jgi:hypothetical protein
MPENKIKLIGQFGAIQIGLSVDLDQLLEASDNESSDPMIDVDFQEIESDRLERSPYRKRRKQ